MPQALLALAGWSLFAFAGAYRWTLVPVAAGTLVAIARVRPRVGATPHRAVDTLLLIVLAGGGAQLLPLSEGLRQWLSPAGETARAALHVGTVRPSLAPLSLDPYASAWSLGTAVTLTLVFWLARGTFERGGLRRVCRGIAWFGLVLAVIVFVQRAGSPHHIYGFWAPITRTAKPSPFGPFVNRNDFASWLLLALPLGIGYLIARIPPLARGRRVPAFIERTLDARMVLLAGSVLLMMAALVASLSRSGLAGIGVGLLAMLVMGRRRLGAAGSGVFATAMVGILLLATQYTNMSALAYRLGDSLPADIGGRVTIWRETWPMIVDFLGVGIGLGAFERGMLLYQQSSRLLFFNHAHNEYLQVLAEGGLLLAVPAAAAVLVGIWTVIQRLRRDDPAVFWIRAGAASSLLAVAVQSIWDTGLRMPANGVLFAVVAAIALHAKVPGESERAEAPQLSPSDPPEWLRAHPATDPALWDI